MPLKVGLTGGIGSGKSLVAEALIGLGIQVINADTIAKRLTEPGSPHLTAIADHFGAHIIKPDGTLDRKALRDIVFYSSTERAWLEAELHPAIRREIVQALDNAATPDLDVASPPYVVLESPLLFETEQDKLLDKVIVVDVPEAIQRQRAATRDGFDEAAIQAIINTQMPRFDRRQRADYVIDNSGPREQTLRQVAALHQTLIAQTLQTDR